MSQLPPKNNALQFDCRQSHQLLMQVIECGDFAATEAVLKAVANRHELPMDKNIEQFINLFSGKLIGFFNSAQMVAVGRFETKIPGAVLRLPKPGWGRFLMVVA